MLSWSEKVTCFSTLWRFFLKMYIFEVAIFFLSYFLSNQQDFSVALQIHVQIQVLDEASLLLTIRMSVVIKLIKVLAYHKNV